MNTSRLAAAAAAVAIGFGVTLAGVAIGDDGDTVDDDTALEVDDEVDGELEAGDDDDADEVSESDEESAETDTVEPEETDGAGDASEPDETVVTEVLDEAPDTTVATPPTDNPANSDIDTGDELDVVRCVPTISVVLNTGEQIDLVVEASEGGTAWRVLDADGSFVISLDDQDVAEVVEVLRNVRFFQGAPINFFDVCDEVDSVDDDASSSDASNNEDAVGESTASSLEFPCSDRALNQLQAPLLDDEIGGLDDVSQVQLALAIRLDELGGRDLDSWWVALEGELVSFRTFSDGCPPEVENGFTRSGLFCAAARISSDDGLFDFLNTVVPAAMSDCTYESG